MVTLSPWYRINNEEPELAPNSGLTLEEILEKTKKSLEKNENIKDIMKRFGINQNHAPSFYNAFQERYHYHPVHYRTVFNSKIKDFLNTLKEQMEALREKKIINLYGVVKLGDYKALLIISKDISEYNFLLSELFRENLISKPGEKRVNGAGLIFGAYQILDLETDECRRSYKTVLKGKGQMFSREIKFKPSSIIKLPERLKLCADHLVRAYAMLNHNT